MAAAIVASMIASVLGFVGQPPAAAHHDPNVNQSVVAYDTAWELGARATRAEMVTYLDHIDQAGFTGFWFSYLTSTGLAFTLQNLSLIHI